MVDFGDPKMTPNLHKQVEQDSQILVTVFILSQFHDVVEKKQVYLITFGKPNNTFYLKASHKKSVLTWLHTKKVIGNNNNIPKWIRFIILSMDLRASGTGQRSGTPQNLYVLWLPFLMMKMICSMIY